MKKQILLDNIHPGEILLEEFLQPLGISQRQLSKNTGIPYSSIARIIQREQAISPDIAKKLAAYLGINDMFWLGLQADYDMEELRRKKISLFSKCRKRTTIKKPSKNRTLINQ